LKNEKLVSARWLVIMREAKSQELRERATITAQTHSRIIDRKNAALVSLEDDLDAAERQHRFASKRHSRNVDQLLRLRETGRKETAEAFATESRALADSFEKERVEIVTAHARHKRDLLDILEAMEKARERGRVARRATFETAREEIKSTDAEAFENAKAKLEKIAGQCEKACEEAHEAYVSGTNARASSFAALTARDSLDAKTIESRMRDFARYARLTRAAKGKLRSRASEWKAKNDALRRARDAMRDHGLSLASETKKFRSEQDLKLKIALSESNGALKKLDQKLVDAERLLKLASASKRLETERERVAPFSVDPVFEIQGDSSLTDFVSSAVSEEDALSTGALDDAGAPLDETRYLERFLRRFNKVYLDERVASKERERFAAENEDLKEILAGYLRGMRVDDGVLRDPNNPLFVSNARGFKFQRGRRPAEREPGGAAAAGLETNPRRLYASIPRRGAAEPEPEEEEEQEPEEKKPRASQVAVFVPANASGRR